MAREMLRRIREKSIIDALEQSKVSFAAEGFVKKNIFICPVFDFGQFLPFIARYPVITLTFSS
jgi:hypothetical protein